MAFYTEKLVSEIMMKSPVTLAPDETLDLADDVITLGRVRHFPILEDGRLVGVISQRQLAGAVGSVALGLKSGARKNLLKSFRIREVMSKPVVTIPPHATIKEAAHLMATEKIGCLPVVDGDSLVGLVTQTDILGYLGKD